MYRLMMGLVFVLLALPLLSHEMGPRKQALLSALIVLAVASDQLTGVIILVLLGARVLAQVRRGQLNELAKWVKIATPGATLFLLIVYAGNIASGIGLLQTQPQVPRPEDQLGHVPSDDGTRVRPARATLAQQYGGS